jgi:hypothetical protein
MQPDGFCCFGWRVVSELVLVGVQEPRDIQVLILAELTTWRQDVHRMASGRPSPTFFQYSNVFGSLGLGPT